MFETFPCAEGIKNKKSPPLQNEMVGFLFDKFVRADFIFIASDNVSQQNDF
jgi:hypothetical protein